MRGGREARHYLAASLRQEISSEIFRPLLREPLPVIRIPLRRGEMDAFIDLQALVNQVHEVGRYHTLDYSRLPELPLSPKDQKWLRRLAAE